MLQMIALNMLNTDINKEEILFHLNTDLKPVNLKEMC